MAGKPKSWKKVRDERRKENFIGRGEPIRIFTENLKSDAPDYMIISITGEGGAGKSTLLAQFVSIGTLPEHNAIVIICDDKQASPVSAMGHIAQKLAEQGITEKDFDERYKKYGKLRQELESDPKAPRGGLDLLAKGATDFTIKSLRKAPGVGVLFESIDEKAAGAALAELIQFSISKWGNKDEVKLLREPEQVLTPLFLKLIRKAYNDHKLVLMFDVFERTSDALAPWLLICCNFEYGEFDTRVMFVLSGREALEQHWTEHADLICHISLEPFTLDELRLYLSNNDLTDDKLVKQIYEDTNGLPVLVELLAAVKPEPGTLLPDVSKDAVDRFLQWTQQEERRQAALFAAVPRQFNRDILSAALGEDAAPLFNWLASQSYIRRTNERGWFYHEKVRDLMLRHLKNLSPGDLAMVHQRLADFFTSENTKLGFKEADTYRNDIWKRMECERLYHATSGKANPVTDLINAFSHAFRLSWEFAAQIARIAHQIGYETDSQRLKETSAKMTDLDSASQQENHEMVIELSSLFLKEEGLTLIAKSALHSRRGRANHDLRKYDLALKDLTISVELDPQNALALAQRGITYLLMGKFDEAMRDLTAAIELDPNNALALAVRAMIYQATKRYEKAIQDITAFIQLDPQNVQVLTARGEIYLAMEKYEEALRDLTTAIQLDPQNAQALAQRGRTYLAMEKYEEALRALTAAIEFDPSNAKVLAQRASTYIFLTRYEEALQDLTTAIQLDPQNVLVWVLRGVIYRDIGKYEEALRDLTTAIQLDPNDAKALAARGGTYLLLTRYEEAIQDFTAIIELDPQNAQALAERASVYRAREKYEEALRDLTAAIELDPQNAKALAQRGEIYLFLTRYEEALRDLTTASQLDPQNVLVWVFRGVIYHLLTRYEEAIQDLTAAIGLDPNNAGALGARGQTYRQMEKYEEALQDLNKVTKNDADNDWWYYQRSLVFLVKDKLDLAKQDLGSAIKFSNQKYKESPTNWANTFNLALYQLAISNDEVSRQLYSDALKEDVSFSVKNAAKDDLEEFIRLFPENKHAKEIRDLFK